MQQQTNMLNLCVGFRFSLFNMKTLFYLKLRAQYIVSAGMIKNLKTRDTSITLIPTTFRSTKRCFTRAQSAILQGPDFNLRVERARKILIHEVNISKTDPVTLLF